MNAERGVLNETGKTLRFVDRFSVILLDMMGTFMFARTNENAERGG